MFFQYVNKKNNVAILFITSYSQILPAVKSPGASSTWTKSYGICRVFFNFFFKMKYESKKEVYLQLGFAYKKN